MVWCGGVRWLDDEPGCERERKVKENKHIYMHTSSYLQLAQYTTTTTLFHLLPPARHAAGPARHKGQPPLPLPLPFPIPIEPQQVQVPIHQQHVRALLHTAQQRHQALLRRLQAPGPSPPAKHPALQQRANQLRHGQQLRHRGEERRGGQQDVEVR